MLTYIEENNVKQIYEEIANHFDNTRTYKWPWINEFIDNLKGTPFICDIGCGNGRNMINNRKYINFIGIDNCIKFIDICKQKNLNVINANMINIPLKNNSVDAILCIAVLHHLSNTEHRLAALLEMKRIIKNNGKILLSVWSKNQPTKTRRTFNSYGNNIVLWNNHGKIYERYYYIFKIDELKTLFTSAGLMVKDHKYSCGNEIFTLIKI